MLDVAVIGGGLAGCATAWYLAREGVSVGLFEQDDIATQASGANAGSIHLQIPHETFMVEGEAWARSFGPALTLLAESIALWGGLSGELGVDLDFVQSGGLLVAETEAELDDIRRKAEIERAFDVPIDLLDAGEVRTLAPYVSDKVIGGAFCPLEGKANPLVATFAIASAARRAGAALHVRSRVEAIHAEDRGFRLDINGEQVLARRVVNAAGADLGRVARMVGIALNVEGHPLQVSVTAPVARLVDHLVYFAGEKLTLKQARNGSLLIGGGWPSHRDPGTGALSVNPISVARNLAVAARAVPAVAGAEVVRTWPAIVNGTADWRPILGEAPGIPGFFLAFFPWMGFTGGPLAGCITADLILGRRTSREIEPFSVAHHWATANAA